jgi:UDP-N-acetylmuramoyl-L-alanyl-D-glutamate--2,6-diaminopimelate ligase
LAYAGVHIDGHDAIPRAIQQGISFLVGEKPKDKTCSLPYLHVRNARAAWAWWESLRAGHPQEGLTILGVTGTNGKTSTVWMTRALLQQSGLTCLSIGTLGAFLGETHTPLVHTTPDPDVLYPLLAKARQAGIQHVVMEVSSHSIEQGKVEPLTFFAAAFTSFSRDHLDFHLTLEGYWHTKTQLFTRLLQREGHVVVHTTLVSRLLDSGFSGTYLYTYGDTKESHISTAHCAIRLRTAAAVVVAG